MQHNNNVDYFGASLNRAERAPESLRLHEPNVDRQIQITTKDTQKISSTPHHTGNTGHPPACSRRSVDSNNTV